MAKPIKFKLKILFSVGFSCFLVWLLDSLGWPYYLLHQQNERPSGWCVFSYRECFDVYVGSFLWQVLNKLSGYLWLELTSLALTLLVFALVMRRIWRR